MSNRVNLERTTFRAYDAGILEESRDGFLLWDDYAEFYNDSVEIPEMKLKPKEFLKLVIDKYASEQIRDMFCFLLEHEKGLYIDNNWFDFDEIKDILEGQIYG